MIAPSLTIAPAPLLSVPEARQHLRVDHEFEDAFILGLIAAAEAWLDGWNGVLGRCIRQQTWTIRTDALQSMRLPFPDVVSATVSYLDTAGATQAVDPANYRVRTIDGQGWLTFAEGFAAPALLAGRDDAVTITAVFGRDTVPPGLRAAALMLVGHWYQNRETVVTGTITAEVPMAVNALIAPWRVQIV